MYSNKCLSLPWLSFLEQNLLAQSNCQIQVAEGDYKRVQPNNEQKIKSWLQMGASGKWLKVANSNS